MGTFHCSSFFSVGDHQRRTDTSASQMPINYWEDLCELLHQERGKGALALKDGFKAFLSMFRSALINSLK